MSWLFSQALVEEYSAATCSDGVPSAQLSVMSTPHKFSRRGKTIKSSSLSLFGLTCEVLMENHGKELLMSFLEGFPVRTSVPQERGQVSMALKAVSGRTWPGSSVKFNQSSLSWKTAQHSLLGESESFSETWPQWGLMLDGECFELQSPDLDMQEQEYGSLLPTPSGVNGGTNHCMGRIDEWGGSSNPLRGTVIGSMCLPEFEEMVMGWPIGWTELTPYEMGKYQEWRREHSKC